MLELIDRLVDDDERRPNEYEIPRPSAVATTTFMEGSIKVEDELTGCTIEDDEKRTNAYDVPRPDNAYDVPMLADAYDVLRPATVATTAFVEGSVKNEDELTGCTIKDDEKRANAYDVPRPADAYDVPTPADAYDVPRPTTVATTTLVEGSVKVEDELTGCSVEDDERRANAYDVPRPTTVVTYYNI